MSKRRTAAKSEPAAPPAESAPAEVVDTKVTVPSAFDGESDDGGSDERIDPLSEMFDFEDGKEEESATEGFFDAEDEEGAEEEEQSEDGGDDQPIDTDLIERAIRLGMTLSQAQSFTDREQLEQLVDTFEQRQQQQQQGEQQGGEDDQAAPGYTVGLDPENFDDEIRGEFQKLWDAANSQISTLQDQLSGLLAEKEVAWFDQKFATLDESLAPVFGGSEKSWDMPQHDPRLSARQEVADLMQALGQRMPAASRDELFQRAVRALHSDKLEAQQRQALTKQLSRQRKKLTARPEGAKKQSLSPEQRAVNVVREMMEGGA